MEENIKKEIIDNANETIDKVSETLKADGSKVKDYVSNMNESDLKMLKELHDVVQMFKKPFWKCLLWIIIIGLLINSLYVFGLIIGKFLANLGL